MPAVQGDGLVYSTGGSRPNARRRGKGVTAAQQLRADGAVDQAAELALGAGLVPEEAAGVAAPHVPAGASVDVTDARKGVLGSAF